MRKVVILLVILCIFFTVRGENKANSGWKDGILFHRSSDHAFMMKLDIRIYLDYTKYFEEDDYLCDGSNLRKARFAVKSQLWGNWEAEFDLDVAENMVEIKDMWAAYSGLPHFKFKLGHYKVPFSLEELTSSRCITFMERAYPNIFAPGRKMAAGLIYWNKYGALSTAIHGQSVDDNQNLEEDEGYGYAGRLTLVPIINDDLTIHLGAGYSWQKPDDSSGIFELKTEPEAKQGNTEFLDTSEIKNVENVAVMGVETVIDWRSLHLQGEYIINNVDREIDHDDYQFKGGYAYLSWLITGEHRPYTISDGEFGKIIPINKYGAFELAFRYSHLDLSDYNVDQKFYDGIQGGLSNSYTGGLAWYFNPNIKLLINYNYVDNSYFADGDSDYPADYDFSVLQTRLLVQF